MDSRSDSRKVIDINDRLINKMLDKAIDAVLGPNWQETVAEFTPQEIDKGIREEGLIPFPYYTE